MRDLSADLLERAMGFNGIMFAPPLSPAEVTRVATSAWGYETRGQNLSGGPGVVMLPNDAVDAYLYDAPDAYLLLSVLKRYHGRAGKPFVPRQRPRRTAALGAPPLPCRSTAVARRPSYRLHPPWRPRRQRPPSLRLGNPGRDTRREGGGGKGLVSIGTLPDTAKIFLPLSLRPIVKALSVTTSSPLIGRPVLTQAGDWQCQMH